jgi:hypothetical protein
VASATCSQAAAAVDTPAEVVMHDNASKQA